MNRSHRRWASLPALALLGALVACQPPPPPDGHDLGVTTNTLPAHLTPGTSAPYNVTVENHGAVDATQVYIHVLVPDDLDIAVVSTQSVGTCARDTVGPDDATLMSCFLDAGSPLQPGATWTVETKLTATAVIASPTVLAVVSAVGSEPTPDPHPNAVQQDMSIDATTPVDLAPTARTSEPSGLRVGTPFTSLTDIETHMPFSGGVFGLSATQTLPPGLQPTSATLGWREVDPFGAVTGHYGSCTITGQSVTCTADATVRYTDGVGMYVEVTPTAAGSFTIGHSVTSAHPEPVPDPNPNTVTSSVTIDPA